MKSDFRRIMFSLVAWTILSTSFLSLAFQINSARALGPPTVLNEQPKNGVSGVYTKPTLSVSVASSGGALMNVKFSTNASSSWKDIATFSNVLNGVYNCTASDVTSLNTKYYWSVSVYDGGSWTNKTYSFTTTSKVLTFKWEASPLWGGMSGVLMADINNDGLEEIVAASEHRVVALRGTDGHALWTYNDANIGWWCQPQMADLNNDGHLEIVVPCMGGPNLLALFGNGSVYWKKQLSGSSFTSSPVIADIDGTGYPTIFAATEDTAHGASGTGRLYKLNGRTGAILASTWAYRPCSGGLSIADVNNDGNFVVFMGDRSEQYANGAQAFRADNLSLIWKRPDIFCSSNIPIPADVNGDGKMEVVVGQMGFGSSGGGFAVLNATDGSSISQNFGIGMPVHKKPVVYDVDGDGRLEILVADSEFGVSADIKIWDLVKRQVDANLTAGLCVYPPQIADITGDGVMDIIAANWTGLVVFSTPRSSYKSYSKIDQVTIPDVNPADAENRSLNYAVVQDIDGDGYNEVVVQSRWGNIYCYDTPARRSNPRARSEVQYYSERRLGVCEFIDAPRVGATTYTFTNGFESGNFNAWTGTMTSSGETVTIANSPVHSGTRSAKYTSNAGGNAEYAFSYKTVNLNEAYAKGYFNIASGLPLLNNGDRFYLIGLSGTSNQVYAGIRRDAGVDRWIIHVMNGANWMNWISNASAPLPSTGKWVTVELHWKESSTAGLVELYINGVKIITITGINTATYGNTTRLDFGLAYAYLQKNITIYGDDATISNTYVAP